MGWALAGPSIVVHIMKMNANAPSDPPVASTRTLRSGECGAITKPATISAKPELDAQPEPDQRRLYETTGKPIHRSTPAKSGKRSVAFVLDLEMAFHSKSAVRVALEVVAARGKVHEDVGRLAGQL